VFFATFIRRHLAIFFCKYLDLKSYVGFCTPRRTVIDSTKKNPHIKSYVVGFASFGETAMVDVLNDTSDETSERKQQGIIRSNSEGSDKTGICRDLICWKWSNQIKLFVKTIVLI